MKRIEEVGGLFINGNPATSTLGTILTAEWGNNVQEEMCTVIEDEGIVLDPLETNQLQAALASIQRVQKFNSGAAGGTANALICPALASIAALTGGLRVALRTSGGANTTTTPTFTPNSGVIAPKIIVKGNNLPLALGDIAGGGHILDLQYDLTLDSWVLFNPAKGIAVSMPPTATETVPGITELATAAEAVAGSSDAVVLTPAKLRAGLNAAGTAPVYAVRAWVHFNGTGVVAINAGGNISGITDLGVGMYRLHFTVNMPNVDYAVAPAAGLAGYDSTYGNKTVSSVEVYSKYTSTGAAGDIAEISCIILC